MNTVLKGNIIDNNPVIKAAINNKTIEFADAGNINLTVDTGFNGCIALPASLLKKINKKLVAYETFTLPK